MITREVCKKYEVKLRNIEKQIGIHFKNIKELRNSIELTP
jgi:hypothetical protein